ncbi:phage holin family protein [Promicromonospora sp. NPDC060271]|uniref:phage holin family protein n=1 Tax=Promicromonospora sp. NPDC060271 TaxID=3347089 RepID=UPI00365B2DEF
MSSSRDPFAASSAAPQTTTGRDDRSIGELVSEVSRDLSTLIRQEIELAKAEAAQSAKRAGKGAGMFGGAGVAGHMVLLFLSLALWWALGSAIGGGWSALVVALVWAVVAAVLAARGRSELKAVEGLPQTADSVKKIPDALKGHEERNS